MTYISCSSNLLLCDKNFNPMVYIIEKHPMSITANVSQFRENWDKQVGWHTRFWYLRYLWASNGSVSLSIYPDLPEARLLAYTKYGCRWRLRPKFRSLEICWKCQRECFRGIYLRKIVCAVSNQVSFDLIWFFTSTQQSFSYAGRVFLGWTSTKLG